MALTPLLRPLLLALTLLRSEEVEKEEEDDEPLWLDDALGGFVGVGC